MKVIEKTKPKKFREWIAMKLVRLAQLIYPESDAVKAFYVQLMHDEMIYGQAVTRVDPNDLLIFKGTGIYRQNNKGFEKIENYKHKV